MQIKSAKELRVYQKAYALAMEIFETSRGWPIEERYSLTDLRPGGESLHLGEMQRIRKPIHACCIKIVVTL
jgi:hypothetical protein